jgi:hypothetical protein
VLQRVLVSLRRQVGKEAFWQVLAQYLGRPCSSPVLKRLGQ